MTQEQLALAMALRIEALETRLEALENKRSQWRVGSLAFILSHAKRIFRHSGSVPIST